MRKRKLLFRITKADCNWQYIRGRGKGGQKRNKTSNVVRCTHRASGASGLAGDSRSQAKNRELAFAKMAQDPVFISWHRLEVSRRTGEERVIEEKVNRGMRKRNIKVEFKKDGIWVEEDE